MAAFFTTIGSPIGGVIVYEEPGVAWQSPPSKAPARVGLAIALVASGCTYISPPVAVANTTNTVWPLAFGEKARPLPLPAQQGYHLFVPKEATVENTTGRVWPLKVQSEKAQPIERVAPQGYHLFVPDQATVHNTTSVVWPLVFGEIARPIERPAQQGDHLFVPAEATVQNTTNKVWPLTFGEKARPIPTPAPEGLWVFGYPYLGIDNTTGIEKWQQPLSRSVPIPRPAPVGGSPFIPRAATVDNTTTTLWPLTFGEVARPIMRVAQQGAWVFGYPYVSVDNNQTLDKWQQPLGRSVPVPRPAPVGGAPFVPAEATVANTVPGGWWQPLQGMAVRHWWPTRPASPFVPAAATIDNTVPGGWWQPFVPGAPRRPFSFTQPVYAIVVVAPPNTVTIDRWQQPLSRSVRIPRNAPVGGQPFVASAVTVQNTIRGIPWLEAWKGPPRIRPAKTQVTYPVRLIPFVANTVTIDKWQFNFRGPPRYRPPRIDGRFYVPHLTVVFHQSIDCDVTVTVDMHICGWGTAAQEAEGFIPESEQADVWTEQTQQPDVEVAQTEQTDAWDEQTEQTTEFDEKDECGR